MKKQITAIMLAAALSLGLAVPASAAGFSDVPASYWACSQINEMVNQGIVGGYNDGTFKPEAPVSYGAFSLMLARAFYPNELTGSGTAAGEAVMNAHKILEGITDRFGASSFSGRAMTREDMSMMMYNILWDWHVSVPSYDECLKKVDSISDYESVSFGRQQAVLTCYTLGLLGGRSDGTFGPMANMTRAQAAVVMSRLCKYIQNHGGTAGTVEIPTGQEPTAPPVQAPTVTDGPLFQMLPGENAETMMKRINDSTTYTPGYLTNGKPITEENIKELLAKFEETMPTGIPWYNKELSGDKFLYHSPKFGSGLGCNSFGYAVSDALFDEQAPLTKHQNFDQLKVGDVVWMKNSENGYSHVFVITSMTNPRGPDRYSSCGAGGTQGVSWNGRGQFETFNEPSVAADTYIYSRY